MTKKYQNAMANANMGFSQLDLATGKIYWDENYRKLYEMPEGQYEGTLAEWFEFLHEDDQQRVQAYFEQFLASDTKVNIYYRICLKNGRVKRIRASGARIFTDGNLTGFEGLCWEDISPMLLQYDVKNSNRFTDSVLDVIPDPLFVKNDRHEVIYANREYEKFVGMTKDQFVGKSDYEFFPKEVADRFWKQDDEVFKAQAAIQNEEVVADSTGRPRIVLTKKTPLSVSENEKIIVGIVRDITDLKQIQASLLAQSKMASLGEMAAGIAHEINNPLSIIRGRALLLKEKRTDGKINADLDLIEQNCIRIEKIVRSLKSVSRNSSNDPFEEVAVLSLIEEAFVIAKERFRARNFQLDIVTGDEISEFDRTKARPAEIVQVLVNLLNNSFDAIHDQTQGWARVGIALEDGNFLIEVVDSGPKISPEVAERMRQIIAAGAKVVTVNGSYQWCIDRNIIPSMQIVMDARPTNARFLNPSLPRCHYALASQCHPDLWDAVEGRPNVWIWHAGVSEEDSAAHALLNDYYLGNWHGIIGGVTVGTRAIMMLCVIGYVQFHVFGMDCCWLDGVHHAYPQEENLRDKRITFKLCPPGGGPEDERTFECAPWHVKQCEGLMQMVRFLGNSFSLNIHGEGLAAYALRSSAGVMIREIAAGAA